MPVHQQLFVQYVFQLENVHFYPGTDRAIEPYSSREIGAFAKFMKEFPFSLLFFR